MITCDMCHENEATIRAEIDGMAEADICEQCARELDGEYEPTAAGEWDDQVAFEREHAHA